MIWGKDNKQLREINHQIKVKVFKLRASSSNSILKDPHLLQPKDKKIFGEAQDLI